MTIADVPLALGFLLAWSLAAPPGPANALMASIAAREGFTRGWLAGLGAVTGDLAMFALMWFGVLRVLTRFPWLAVALAVAGAALLAYFAYGALRQGLAPPSSIPAATSPAWQGYARGFAIIMTSPFNWAWWVTAGASLFARLGWQTVVGFFAGLLLWTVAWSAAIRWGAQAIQPLVRWISLASAAVLAAFAGLVAWGAVRSTLALLGA